MNVIETIEQVLARGCRLSLEDAFGSPVYIREKTITDALHGTHPEGTPLGIALRAGHLVMGPLLQTMDDAEAINAARTLSSPYGHGMELRPLIWSVGDALVTAAGGCLSDDIRAMADEWRTASADEQIAIAKRLFHHLGSIDQRQSREIRTSNMHELLLRSLERNRHLDAAVLPAEYGNWERNHHVANCQGKTQMLAAFARLAGTRGLSVHQIHGAREEVDRWRLEITRAIGDDIRKREIRFPCENFADSHNAEMLTTRLQVHQASFHICIALELCDGRWVLIDPHALDWGVFPDVWDIPGIATRLTRYRDILPGIHVVADDLENVARLKAELMSFVDECFERSQTLQTRLCDIDDAAEFVQALIDSGEVPFIFQHTQPESDWEALLQHDAVVDTLAWGLFLGEDATNLNIGRMFEIIRDPDGLEKRMGMVLTAYHWFATEAVRDQWTDSGRLLHPVCAFGHLEYDLAIAAINSLSIGRYNPLSSFLLDHVFDQVSLSNALVGALLPISEEALSLAHAAAEAIDKLPFLHPQCRKRRQMTEPYLRR